MLLRDCATVFIMVGLAGVLLFAYPTVNLVLRLPGGEKFSELWLLGPGHIAEDYPFNVTASQNYTVYVGISNHMGSSIYYVAYVKFRNLTEALPNSTAGTPSPLPPLYEYRVFLQNGEGNETLLTFSFSQVTFSENLSSVGSLTINSCTFVVNKTATWDSQRKGYYYQLFVELWIFNVELGTVQFHNRYVNLRLNMTSAV